MVINNAENINQTQVSNLANRLKNDIKNKRHELRAINSLLITPYKNNEDNISDEMISKLLSDYINIFENIQTIVYYDINSNKLIHIPTGLNVDKIESTTRPWYKSAMTSNEDTSITEPYKNIVTGDDVYSLSILRKNDKGHNIGIISFGISVEQLNGILKRSHSHFTSTYYLLDSAKNPIASSAPEDPLVFLPDISKKNHWRKRMLSLQENRLLLLPSVACSS